LELDEPASLIARHYRIFAGGHPIMLICEKFSETSFTS